MLCNHPRHQAFIVERDRLWFKRKGAVRKLLPDQEDKEGFASFLSPPPTMVIGKTIDIVANKIHANALAESRKKVDEVKKVLATDFKGKSKECWRTVREPCPASVKVTFKPDGAVMKSLLTLRSSLHDEVCKVWQPIFVSARQL